ncbi:MAG: ABC transporter substrate-binding protein [Nocardiopsaceae bacterium]|nr:ABC transporter substrate-binding protein [Nocardiopsaceae bacterium]
MSLTVAATVLAATVAAVPAVVSTASPAAAGTSASGPTLRVEAQTAFSTFNPFTAYFDGDLEVIEAIYPMLLQTNKSGKPVPYLATKWSLSSNHLTWTFNLRPGLKWSDGKPLTASDVAWTYNLIMHNPAAGTANGSLVQNFKSVTAPNPTTVVIKTKKPQANVPYVVAGPTGIPVVPKHVWASKVKNLSSYRNQGPYPVVGYGPWTLTGYVPDQYATLAANKNFYAGPPAYHRLIVQYYSSSDAAVAALRTGALDEMGDGTLNATQFEALKHANGVSVYPTVSNDWTGIEINTGARTQSGKAFGDGNPLLKDPVIRKAIALAINRKELVSKVLDGLGIPGAGYLTPAYPQWSWKPSPSQAENYNPAEANKILDAAGYKRGPGGVRVDPKTHKPLSFRFGIHSDDPFDPQIAPYIVEWLGKVGIKLNVQPMSFNQLNTVLPKGDWDLLMDDWAQTPDPSYLFSIQTCGTLPKNTSTPGNTDAFFCNHKFDKLYNAQLTEFNQDKRVRDVRQMQSLLYNANVDIMLYYKDILDAVRTAGVKDYAYGSPNSQGLYPLQADYINWLDAKPVAGGSGGIGTGVAVGVPIAAVVIIGGIAIYALRRRRTAEERE